MLRSVVSLFVSFFSVPAMAANFGVAYEVNQTDFVLQENLPGKEYGTIKFAAQYHTISLLDYSGFFCAGFETAGNMMQAREKALENAPYNEKARRTGVVEYSYKVAQPVAGSSCGFRYHMSHSSEKARVSGATIADRSTGGASVTGWGVFGVFAGAIGEESDLFWKVTMEGDFRTVTIKGTPPDVPYMPYYKYDEMTLNMPIELEIGKVFNVGNIGSFVGWGMVGYDMINWMMKALLPEDFPSSFLRYGAGAGYQTPIDGLQVRLGYKKTDSVLDGRGMLESGYTLGLYYQM